jgi:ubiquinone biosynthesis protein
MAEEGFAWLADGQHVPRLRIGKRRRPEEPGDMPPEQHVRHALERLGVAFIKGGQALSTRTDIISPELASELGKLQDEVPPAPWETMRAVIEADLERPLSEAFGSFDTAPIGAASIGQVYAATLPDGTPVAVKVQRPGMQETAATDLDIAVMMAGRAKAVAGASLGVDIEALAVEFADAVRGEFDYVNEAHSAQRLRQAFEGDETVVIPRLYWTQTTHRVLTVEPLDGVRMNRIDELDAAGYDRPLLALRGINAYLHMIFDLGFFHADPHPGNFIALPGDRVGFTDFGRVGTMSSRSRDAFLDLLNAVVHNDPQQATDTLLELAGTSHIDETKLYRDVARLIGKYHGKELGGVRAGDLFGDTLGLFRRHQVGVPNDFAVMLGTLAVLQGLGTMLDPTFDFTSAVRPFVERAVSERLTPSAMLDRLGTDLRRAGRTLERLPVMVDRILRRAARGELRIEFALRDYERLLQQTTELVNRLAFAVVVGALIVGATQLLRAPSLPQWLRVVGETGLVAALVVSVWFFAAIIAAHYRAQRRR